MKKFIYLHRFFVKESKSFVGTWIETSPPYYCEFTGRTIYFGRYKYSIKQSIYFPVAYCKFMYYSLFKDYK